MIKCHIVQDLMPNYVDGLVQAETAEDIRQHLLECETCRTLHATMSAPMENTAPQPDPIELDYLKKVRKRTFNKLIAGSVVLMLVFAALTYLMAIGSPVDKKDLVYTAYVEGNEWRIDLQLTNGKSLLVRTEPIYGEAGANGIKPIVGTRVKPYQLVPSPLLEKGNDSFMYGGTLSGLKNGEYKIILQMADSKVDFTSENFME